MRHHSQLSGISNGISSSSIGLLSKSFFFNLPSFTRCSFSLRMRWSSTEAGSSSGSWATSLPWMACCRMLFLSCWAFISQPPFRSHTPQSIPVVWLAAMPFRANKVRRRRHICWHPWARSVPPRHLLSPCKAKCQR